MEYKRFISYLYAYVSGEKGVNVGYIRCEQREGICRLTLSLQDRQSIEDGRYKVYLYKENQEHIPIGYYLDELTIRKNCGELRKQTTCDNVWNTNHRIEDFDGVIVIYDKAHMYISPWKEIPVRTDRFLTYQDWQDTRKTELAAEPVFIKESDGLARHIAELPQKQTAQSGPGGIQVSSESPETPKPSEEVTLRNSPETVTDTSEPETAETLADASELEAAETLADVSEPEAAETVTDTSEPETTETLADTAAGETQEEPVPTVVPDGQEASSETIEQRSLEEPMETAVLEAHEARQEGAAPEPPETTVLEQAVEQLQSSEKTTKPKSRKSISDLTLRLMRSRPKLPDFDNHEIFDCVRIQPNDIGLLEMENWRLGVNSFLTHGYYNYKYLMLGKLRFQDGAVKAVLGVPGVFDNKEQYIAKIFGFEMFVPVKHTNIKTGNLGYWIVELT